MDGTANEHNRPVHLLDDDEYWYAGDEDFTKENEQPTVQSSYPESVSEETASLESTPQHLTADLPPLSIEELAAKYPAIIKHNIFQVLRRCWSLQMTKILPPKYHLLFQLRHVSTLELISFLFPPKNKKY